MQEAFFHEDNYCQIELLPIANADFCQEEMTAIADFSVEHKEGEGWNNIYLRADALQTLLSLNITKTELEEKLNDFMPLCDRVLTGYSTYREECSNAVAFGVNNNLILFAQYNDAQLISTLWLTLTRLDRRNAGLALQMFEALSTWRLLLVDWSMSIMLFLTDTKAVRKYVDEYFLS